jgi:hypothetical protein
VGPDSPEGQVTTAWEAERVNRTPGGATANLVTDGTAGGGFWVTLLANSTGDFLELTLPNVPAGTYQLALRYKAHPNRGILQARLDGNVVGSPLDQFSANPQFRVQSFGAVTFPTHTSHVVRLTVTGRNPAAGMFTLSADEVRLTPVAAPASSPEAEGLDRNALDGGR